MSWREFNRAVARAAPLAALVIVGLLGASTLPAAGAGSQADTVLAELKSGNRHHATAKYAHPHQTSARVHELVAAQHPHAVILSCADSRVTPEIVFDQGLGDLFDVRVAGNIAAPAEIASIEYAVEHLHTPLVVVLGHQSCGAVAAAIQGGEAGGHLVTLIDAIRPAVEQARKLPGDLADNAVRLNTEMVVGQLRASQPVLAEAVTAGRLRIVGAIYSLETGKVTWLPEPAH
jgi:carbonic anhydrase